MSRHLSTTFVTEILIETQKSENEFTRRDLHWVQAFEEKRIADLEGRKVILVKKEEAERLYALDTELQKRGINVMAKVLGKSKRIFDSKHYTAVKKIFGGTSDNIRAIVADGGMEDIQLYRDFLSTAESTLSFSEWHEITTAYRVRAPWVTVAAPKGESELSTCLLNDVPTWWKEDLSEKLAIKDPGEVLVTSLNERDITREEISALVPDKAMDISGGWLNFVIVDAYFQILANSAPTNTGVIYVAGFVLGKLAKPSKAAIVANAILLPLYLEGSRHWVLFLIGFARKTMIYMDSLGTGMQDTVEKVLTWVQELMGESHRESWTVMQKECPVQAEEASCGVCMCINAVLSSQEGDVSTAYSAKDIPWLRRWIAAIICQGQLP